VKTSPRACITPGRRTSWRLANVALRAAADDFKDKTTASNQLWQTDFTYPKVTGWGWFYRSTIWDDFSRYIIAWKLCTTMKVGDHTETLDLACKPRGLIRFMSFIAPDCSQTMTLPTSRPISPNGWTIATWVTCAARRALTPATAGQDRALAPDAQKPHLA
jgi:transposase InsO family protein